MAENSKTRRQKPSNHIPEEMRKDAKNPNDIRDVELTGKALEDFLDGDDSVCE